MKVPRLGAPWWQEVVYYLFVAVAPIVITCIELYDSHSTVFKWSFASIGSILITFLLLKKFILGGKINKLKEKCILLEHDYSIEVGNKKFIEAQWKRINLFLYIYNAITVILSGALLYLFITALSEQLIAFQGAATLIVAFVCAGIIFKACTFISVKEEDDEGRETTK